MTADSEATPSAAPPRAFSGAGRLAQLNAVILGLLLAAWAAYLWPQWLHNPDLSHGLFTPVLVLCLAREARHAPHPRFFGPSPALTTASVAALLASWGLLALGGLYAAALGWGHALVAFLVTCALASLFAGAWLSWARRSSRLLPFAWPAAAAIVACVLSAPIPPGSYTRLTQHLQLAVTDGVMATLQLLGIAAVKSGNVITLSHVSVGVEDACSGVRSLISCVVAGVVLSAFLVRSPWRRAALIALSGPLALAMNFVRSLALTLLAERGVEIRGAWHDLTGFGILALTAALLAAVASFLGKRDPRPEPRRSELGGEPPPSPAAAAWPQRCVGIATVGTLAIAGTFVLQTRSSVLPRTPPVAIEAVLPETYPGWDVRTQADLYRFSAQLQTTQLVQKTYTRTDAEGLFQVTVYVAYWPPGQAPVSLVASHTPDACWPGSGWRELPEAHGRVALQLASRPLPAAEHRAFQLDGFPQQVWYWHFYDGVLVRHGGTGSPAQLLSLAWRYGFRKEGPQVFIRISSNRAWPQLAREPLLAELARHLQPLGL